MILNKDLHFEERMMCIFCFFNLDLTAINFFFNILFNDYWLVLFFGFSIWHFFTASVRLPQYTGIRFDPSFSKMADFQDGRPTNSLRVTNEKAPKKGQEWAWIKLPKELPSYIFFLFFLFLLPFMLKRPEKIYIMSSWDA